MRKCKKCGVAKPLRMFECTNVERGWYRLECMACTRERQRGYASRSRDEIAERQTYWRNYHLKNRDKKIAKAAEWARQNPERRRTIALNHYYRLQDAAILAYGGYQCSWCGIDEPMVLTLDHVNNDGNVKRKGEGQGAALYRGLRDRGYPDGYAVLCMNCNHAKMRNRGVLLPSLKGRFNDQSESS